ncbi:MAG: hypothetical protein A2Z20_00675 [Bdellovibrionales bacterium RBG_16_40_8]|nr:MAG: hypothetical protein A2Z20_00675 [Bdellovibrionales bacterium RBG_16_40_8]
MNEFLIKTLGTNAFQVIPLAGDASARRYLRIVRKNESFVLMAWEPFTDDGQYPFLNVQNHFAKHGVQVPQVIAKDPKQGLVLLEDLGDLTLERKFWESQNQELALPYYQQAIDELIKIHHITSKDINANCVAFKISFDVDKLLWEMNYGHEHLIEKLCHIKLSPQTHKELQTVFVDICTTLHKEPKLICHRDYHSRNIMLKLGKTYIIDFQDARMGPIQYDLVSLVHDSYVDMNEILRQKILDYYLINAQKIIPQGSRDHFNSMLQLQLLQRCFKACGSFASFYNTREDRRYLKYLKPTITKVASALEQYPSYAVFLKVLRDNGLLEHDYMNPTEI